MKPEFNTNLQLNDSLSWLDVLGIHDIDQVRLFAHAFMSGLRERGADSLTYSFAKGELVNQVAMFSDDNPITITRWKRAIALNEREGLV